MKTPEEWSEIWYGDSPTTFRRLISRVQKEAVKHGMTLAAAIAERRTDGTQGHSVGRRETVAQILTARDHYKI